MTQKQQKAICQCLMSSCCCGSDDWWCSLLHDSELTSGAAPGGGLLVMCDWKLTQGLTYHNMGEILPVIVSSKENVVQSVKTSPHI